MKNMSFRIDYDSWLMIIKGFIYFIILIYASYEDLKTKTIPDKVHVCIILIGLLGDSIINSIMASIVISLPFMITALVKDNGIGGGDVKFMAVNGFALGIKKGLSDVL